MSYSLISKPKNINVNEINLSGFYKKNHNIYVNYISYKNQPLLIQTDYIEMKYGGVSLIDNILLFINIPLDSTQDSCNELKEFLNKLDNNLKNKFDNKYSSVIKKFLDKSFLKINLSNLNHIKFYVYDAEKETHNLISIKSYDDLKSYINYNSKCRFIIQIKCIWTNENKYGLNCKIIAIEFVKDFKKYMFEDEEIIDNINIIEEEQNVEIQENNKNIKENKEAEEIKNIQAYVKILEINEEIEKECCICYNNILTFVILLPCQHKQFCKNCVDQIKDKKCPLCRQFFYEIK